MEKVNRIVAVFLMALIGCVTVFQCHHHDGSGHAFFLTYSNVEITGGLHSGDCHSHDCDHDGDDCPDPCGMHLSEMLTTEDSADTSAEYANVGFDIFVAEYEVDFSERENIVFRNSSTDFDISRQSDAYIRDITRRGPPCGMV